MTTGAGCVVAQPINSTAHKSKPGTAASLPPADRQNAADAGIAGQAEPTSTANAITRRRKVSMFELSPICAFNNARTDQETRAHDEHNPGS